MGGKDDEDKDEEHDRIRCIYIRVEGKLRYDDDDIILNHLYSDTSMLSKSPVRET